MRKGTAYGENLIRSNQMDVEAAGQGALYDFNFSDVNKGPPVDLPELVRRKLVYKLLYTLLDKELLCPAPD